MDRPTAPVMTFWADEDGATVVEYALMITLIAVAVVASARTLGQNLLPQFQKAITALH